VYLRASACACVKLFKKFTYCPCVTWYFITYDAPKPVGNDAFVLPDGEPELPPVVHINCPAASPNAIDDWLDTTNGELLVPPARNSPVLDPPDPTENDPCGTNTISIPNGRTSTLAPADTPSAT